MAKQLDNIIEFYGETCPHCVAMRPVIDKLEKKRGIIIRQLEVWNNTKNRAVMERYADIIGEACGGYAAVPSFVNTDTGQALCGAHEVKEIETLIDGGDCSGNVCKPHTKLN